MKRAKEISFIKMHGAGNDFVFLEKEKTKEPVTGSLARRLLDRHFGVGGDQLLVLSNGSGDRRFVLDIYNQDGSMAEMCGNGVRAVASFLRASKGLKKDFVIQTKAGPIGIGLKGNAIEVDMGKPILEGRKIPVRAAGEIVSRPLKVNGKTFMIHSVSMGNPHCVIFVKDVERFSVPEFGPLIEHHPFFPNRVNVEFVQVVSPSRLKVRVWERGAGETLACGTGACAVAVASARAGKASRNVEIDLPGGRLGVRWGDNDHVFLRGPAVVSFKGTFLL